MQRTDIVLGLGSGLSYLKYTVPFSDLNSTAALAVTNNFLANPSAGSLLQIPQGGKMLGLMVHATQPFAGTAITAASIAIGGVGLANNFFSNPFDVFQPVANNTLLEVSMFKSGSIAPVTINYTFTVIGANLTALTAGSVDVYILIVNVSTPAA